MEAHKRRKRYSGTHPKTFEEKYKEHDPEKYADTVARVIGKGSTPAGMHLPIMADEVLQALRIQPGEIGLDATLGYGGHARRMLERLQGRGHLFGLDVDPIEIVKTRERLRKAGYGEDIFTAVRENFAHIDTVAQEQGPFQFVMADLGVSSMQIDNPERGFSYKLEGALDLRLDPENGIPAWQRLAQMNREEIQGMLEENADEPYAREIAGSIVKLRKKGAAIRTTTDLRGAVEAALVFLPENGEKRDLLKKTCQRVFQALRIDINNEFEVLEAFLDKLPQVLAEGGRVVILTFHSGEDRLVKKAFQEYYRQHIFAEISRDVVRPSPGECRANGRARSTKLRWAVKA